MNKFLDQFFKKTLWIWLPFVAFFKLLKDLVKKIENK